MKSIEKIMKYSNSCTVSNDMTCCVLYCWNRYEFERGLSRSPLYYKSDFELLAISHSRSLSMWHVAWLGLAMSISYAGCFICRQQIWSNGSLCLQVSCLSWWVHFRKQTIQFKERHYTLLKASSMFKAIIKIPNRYTQNQNVASYLVSEWHPSLFENMNRSSTSLNCIEMQMFDIAHQRMRPPVHLSTILDFKVGLFLRQTILILLEPFWKSLPLALPHFWANSLNHWRHH